MDHTPNGGAESREIRYTDTPDLFIKKSHDNGYQRKQGDRTIRDLTKTHHPRYATHKKKGGRYIKPGRRDHKYKIIHSTNAPHDGAAEGSVRTTRSW
jgi:hypothetical protein